MAIEVNTKTGLISRGLMLIGEKPAQDLDEDRYGVEVGAEMFDMIYENELQSNRWRFAMNKAALSRLADVPLNQWRYAYQLPADMLLLSHVYPVTDYEVFGDRIYTDREIVEIDYVFKPDISKLPAYFCTLMTYALARDMVKPVTEDKEAVLLLQKKYAMQRDRAMYADAQGRPATSIQRNPFLDVRG